MTHKLYLTHLTFSDIQRKDFAKTPAEDAKMEFVGLNVPVMDMRHYPIGRERRASRAIGCGRDPRVQEIVGRCPEYERAGLP